MEFNYTLSVFISEIPLANMVFEFTKALYNLEIEAKMSKMQFEEGDVWSILNYIGLKCSSEHALKIVEKYKSEKQPLLLCILECVSMYQKEEEHISDQSTITQSSDTLDDRAQGSHRHISKCKHFSYCKACQNRVAKLKEKYKRRKAGMEKMFQQLKQVYEAEVETVKEEQHKKIKQSIASHALQLQMHREKMEQSFKAREDDLSKAIQQKKRFLWGLARSLRDQHAHLARAMTDVRRQTERLTHKESSLKTQLEEAEQTLKKRGEDMRNQISDELIMMERHLENMKKERDLINEERKKMENLKNNDTNTHTDKDLGPQYDFIKTELTTLRKYIEATKLEPNCVEGTVPDFGVKCYMNNENIRTKKENMETGRVINDLKKQNNIHFNKANLDDITDIISERLSTVSSVGDTGVMRDDTGDIRNKDIIDEVTQDVDKTYTQDRHLRVGDIQDGAPGDTRGLGSDMDLLRQENDRLKIFARQQREYIQALFNEKDRLQRALTDRSRPRTAPIMSNYFRGPRRIPDASCPRGSASGQVRGFTAVGGATGRDTRGWWMRRASGTTLPLHATKEIVSNFPVEETHVGRADEIYQHNASHITQRPNQQSVSEAGKVREISKEVKEKLRSKMLLQSTTKASDNSSDVMLRDAKRRLRKLEIEAEAVEKSYQDFRRRQRELKEARDIDHVKDNLIEKGGNLDLKQKPFETYEKTTYDKNVPSSFPKESPEAMKKDFDKYFKEYTSYLDFTQLHFANKNSVIKNVKPIPSPLSTKKDNYIETPLMEFRKLYQGQRTIKNNIHIGKDVLTDKNNSVCILKSEKCPNFINNQNNVELHELKTSPKPKLIAPTESTDTLLNNIDNEQIKEIDNKNNLLMVEVENGCDVVVPKENQNMLIVVESSVDNTDISDVKGEIFPHMTIIVSPKNKGGSKDFESSVEVVSRSASPKLSQLNALKPIFHTDNKELSSVDFQIDLSKDNVESISEVEKNQDDYLDDFSADVDNYNSRSEYGNNSPISLPKTTEDEAFWES